MVREATLTAPLKRRSLDIRTFDELAQEVNRLAQSNYRKVGNWDLGQICDHLTVVMDGSMDGFRFADWSWFWRRVFGPIAIRWVLLTRSMKKGLECPDPSFCPTGLTPTDQAVARFQASLKRVQEHTGDFKPHPALGKVSAEQWREIHLIHAAHHLSFLLPE